MNGLNCESKIKRKKFVMVGLISAACGFLLAVLIFALIIFSTPAFADLLILNGVVKSNFKGEYSYSDLKDGILSGYIDSLNDKYASYYNVNDTKTRTEHLLGVGQGLGLSIIKNPDRESIYVLEVYEDSPAKNAGIIKGDEIISVDGYDVLDVGYTKSVDMMKKAKDEKILLKILREDKTLNIEITVSDIVVQSVFFEVIDNYGYVKVTSFNAETVPQFKNAINSLIADNVKGLIFDIRNNGGGTVSSVGNILDFLLPEGNVMSVEYKNGRTEVNLKSGNEEIDLPMTVLTNASTASAAELFAANIRDFNKGVLIGEKTYGKGVMQNTYELLSGVTVVFTVAEFKPHSNVSFNNIGISPDIEIEITDEEKKYSFFRPIGNDKYVLAAVEWLNNYEKK